MDKLIGTMMLGGEIYERARAVMEVMVVSPR
jgi:hypothetical protein